MSIVLRVIATLVVGFVLFPPIMEVLEVLSTDMVSSVSLNAFEAFLLAILPAALLVNIFYRAVMTVKGKKSKEED